MAKNNFKKTTQSIFADFVKPYLVAQYSKYKKQLLALLIFAFGFLIGAMFLAEYPSLFGKKIVISLWQSHKSQSNLESDPLLAKAGKIEIYKSDVKKYLQNLNPELTDKNFDELNANVKKVVINELIGQKLFLQQALKENLQNNPEVKNSIEQDAQNLVRLNYLSGITKQVLSDENVKSIYEQIVGQLKNQNEIEVNHILVANQNEAQQIYQQLQNYPRSFAKIAIEKSLDKNTASNGGKVGYIVKGTLLKELEDNAFALKVGEISKPFQTTLGWHIVKVSGIRPATILSYEQSRPNIIKQLTKNTLQNQINNLIKENHLEVKYY